MHKQSALTHETGRELGVRSDLVVNLDEALGNNEGNLSAGQSVPQSVTEEDLNVCGNPAGVG